MVGIQTITVNCSYTWLVQWKKYVSVFSSDETFCNVNELDQHQYISIYHKGNMLQLNTDKKNINFPQILTQPE